jgi:hypothetical protein
LFVTDAIRNYSGAINANFNLFSGFEAINTIKRNKQEMNINRANIERVRYNVTIDLRSKIHHHFVFAGRDRGQ